MYRKNDSIIEFKNHNINIKLDWYYKKLFFTDKWTCLNDILSTLDCYFIGDYIWLGNFNMGVQIYNLYSDVCYILSDIDISNLKKGKSVKLYAYKPSIEDREIIKNELEL